MTCAMLSVPLVDGIAKHLSGSYSPLFLAWARYAVASLIVLPIAAMTRAGRCFRRSDGCRICCGPSAS